MSRVYSYFAILLAVTGLCLVAHPAHAEEPDPTPAPSAAPTIGKAPSAAKDPKAKPTPGEAPEHEGPPIKMKVAIALEKISEIKLDTGTFVAEFFAETTCDRKCTATLDPANGEIMGKPEKIAEETLPDGKHYRLFKMKARLHTIVDLGEYPFDTQTLPIFLEEKSDTEEIDLDVDIAGSKVDTDVSIPGWDVKRGDATLNQEEFHGHKVKQIVFTLEIGRPRLAAVFKSLVPVIALIFVAAFSLILKPKSAQARLNAAAGGLVPVVMFQVGQLNTLPPIGYLTRLDKFMIATYIVYVVHIAFSVLMVRADEKKNEKGAELFYLVAAGAVPGVALVAWLLVFLKFV